MLTIEQTKYEPPFVRERRVEASELFFPCGLLGFESSKRFRLVAPKDTQPFMWLEGQDGDRHSFLVVPPSGVLEHYTLNLSDEDVDSIGLVSPEDGVVLNIATCHSEGKFTVNLKGPIIYNRDTLVARQVVPQNSADLPLAHHLDA